MFWGYFWPTYSRSNLVFFALPIYLRYPSQFLTSNFDTKFSIPLLASNSTPKGGFFSESAMYFSHCQDKYPKSLSWAWNLNKLFTLMGRKFKFQVFWNIFWGDLKNWSHLLKKGTFSLTLYGTRTQKNTHNECDLPTSELTPVDK